jgi:hypothetical protein
MKTVSFMKSIYSHPWETVASAAWRKYPNPITPSVLGTDVIDRKVVNGVLHTHRLVSSQWGFPRWTKPVCIKLIFHNFLGIYLSHIDSNL